MKEIQRKRILGIIVTLLITGILFYIMNIYTPLFADDYDYSFSFADGRRITSIMQIPESQQGHYYSINGRFTTHTIAQMFLFLGKSTFNVINVAGFLLLGLLIFYHATGELRKLRAGPMALIYAALFLLTPAFGQSYLWVDGSATYLYGVMIALFYLIPYRKVLQAGEAPAGIVRRCVKFMGMLAFGIFAGNTFENMGAALIIVSIVYMVIFVLKGIKIRVWMLGIGNVLGVLLSVLAPGTRSRLADVGGISLTAMIKNVYFVAADFVEYLWLPLAFVVFMMIIQWNSQSKETPLLKRCRTLTSEISCTCIYTLGALAAAFSMILSPQFPERAWSAPVVLMIIAVVSAIPQQGAACSWKKHTSFALAVLVSLSCATWFNAYFELKSTYYYHQDRVTKIETAVKSGESSVSIPAITSHSRYSVFSIGGDLVWDSGAWPNRSMARYFGIDQIVRQPGDSHN